MATIINNRATVNYRYGTNTASTVSNITNITLDNALNMTKSSLSGTYREGENITFIISLQNDSNDNLTINIVDDLGTYTFEGNEYTPLTFTGDASLFIDGVFDSALTPTVVDDELVFESIVLPPNSNALILYSATANEFANTSVNGEITNTATATITCDCPCAGTVSDSNTITAEEFADIQVIKSGCSNNVVCGDTLSYSIEILNFGNIPATDVVLTDTFTPPLSDITVSVDGVVIPQTDYSYVNGTLTLPNEGSATELVVPAATFTQNPTTGIFEVIPGRLEIVITGTI